MKKHPLLNPESSHYDSQGRPAIFDFEEIYTVGELMAWAKLNRAKYEHPARAAKGQVESDKRKAQTYANYHELLSGIILRGPYFRDVSAQKAYEILGYEWED